jgi:FG-GAP repeat
MRVSRRIGPSARYAIAGLLVPGVVALCLAAASGAGAAPAGGRMATSATADPDVRLPNVKADFNDDGYDDLAISVFAYDDGSILDAGAVSVIYGSPAGLDATAGPGNQLWTQDSPGMPDQSEEADLFGRSLAAADFDNDGYSDLAIGAPHEDIEGFGAEQGAVTVLYGSAAGLTVDRVQYWTQDSPGIKDRVEPGDLLGRSLYGADFNNDGYADLAIGVAYEDVGDVFDSGAVSVIYGSATGLAGPGNQFISQDTPGILDQAEPSERFGWSVTGADYNGDGFADLAIGVPGEALNGFLLAGAVNVLYGSPVGLLSAGNQFFNQDTPGMLDQVETNDLFGRNVVPGDFNADGYADLIMAVPSEGVGDTEIPDAGACAVVYGSATGLDVNAGPGNQLWTQDSPGVKDMSEAHDHFCRHVGVGDYNGDGYQDMSIGVVSEDLGNIPDAGAVNVLYGGPNGLSVSGNQIWSQDSPGILGEAEYLDAFGRAATGFDFNGDGFSDLAVGVPGDHVIGLLAAGSVNAIYGSASQLTSAGNQLWNMDSPDMVGDPQNGALFGAGLPGIPAGGCGAGGTCQD